MTDDLLHKFAELNPVADADRFIAFDAAGPRADRALLAVLEHARTNGDRPDRVRSADVRNTRPAHPSEATRGRNGDMQATEVRPDQRPKTHRRPRTSAAVGAAAAVILAVTAGLVVLDPSDEAPVVSPGNAESEVTELLNGFLEARVAGEAAQQYLNVPEEDIPLLYATTSGAPYERAEFEPVHGIEWPYGFAAFKVRLYAGDTVVEQLFFTPHDDPEHFPADGRLRLEYQPDGFGTHIAPTTEDGQPVAMPHTYFDGEVTLYAAHPWVLHDESSFAGGGLTFGRLIPEGPGVLPTTDGGQRSDWDELVVMADPAPVERDCRTRPAAVDAEALAESIRSHPDIEATTPVAVRPGGVEALMVDVTIAPGTSICTTADPSGNPDLGVMRLVFDTNAQHHVDNGVATGSATGDRMRLYLFDVPEGSSMRILAVAIVAPESSFERAVEAAAPLVDSVEFHAS